MLGDADAVDANVIDGILSGILPKLKLDLDRTQILVELSTQKTCSGLGCLSA